ncbi:MAG: putative DNA-binding protein [Clostridia bacterium]|nr:putative DNA-binding protein [Clostridia bacterium]MDO4382174.1 putative DNA-binding protein [Clostridia bacterium]MEE0790107.1 putative DNA-binding protein [Clostridia bacterium]HCF64927.1 putative DNA-binding protein [Clostridiales bacterium]HJJ09306.1 putative DNA-binding protein [Clostridiaceae bacterium]
MEKKVQISMLLQIYGAMLTEKQYGLLDDYYNNDLSLSEIAENYDITRQAVRDIIKKGENKLFELEEKLSVMDRMLKQDKKIQQILEELCKIQNSSSDKKIEKILNNVTKELSLMRI